MIARTTILCILLVNVLGTKSSAQVLYTLSSPNEEPYGQFGSSVSGAGDVNGDGCADIVVGAIQEDPGQSPYNSGRAYVFDGQTGTLLHMLVSPNEETGGYFGKAVSGSGDVNGDGYDDVVVGAHGEDTGSSTSWTGRAYVFDGQTGNLLNSLLSPNEEEYGYFGISVSGAGDVNGDGYDDVVVGASGEDPGSSPRAAGRAYVFDGQTGDPLHTLISPNEEVDGYFGRSVSGSGDVNGDGYDDVVVGADAEGPGSSPPFAGRAYVFDGQGGILLRTLVSPNEEFHGHFGGSVSDAGDVNGDGYDDVVVGAHGEDTGSSTSWVGRAYVFDGETGNPLHTLASPNEESDGCFGISVSSAGDVNGDGYDDVVVGARWENPGTSPEDAGRAYVFDGLTGSLLHTLVSPNEESNGNFGDSVSGSGDVNGDGHDDVVIGAYREDPGSSPEDAGRAYVFDGFLIPVELTGFTASVEEGAVILRWTTLSEHENYGFHVHRSRETAGEYLRITDGIIPGAGTSSVRHDYSYADENVLEGCYYSYKVADIDFQGHMTLHGPLSVTVLPTELTLHSAYPNPFNSEVTLKLHLSTRDHVRLSVYDPAGKRVRMLVDEELEVGQHEIDWDGMDEFGENVAPGAYTLRAQSADKEYTRNLIRIR
jgi:hypothetical protein